MPKRRRKPPRRLSDLSAWIAPGGLDIALMVLIGGFVHFTRIAVAGIVGWEAGRRRYNT